MSWERFEKMQKRISGRVNAPHGLRLVATNIAGQFWLRSKR